ncbi:MAG: (NiFe) hydrogenase maturation protein HypF [Candidatus Bathyarchaeota archaeon BA2]|nr:MAG: (NiFe) hydrogenase maturation protein HypF [Candidatus Bathyarchaeota archaeon BA2]
MHAEIKVSGIVQGVGFRPFVYRVAVENGLVGYVRNRGDAVVEIVVEGKKKDVKRFLKNLKEKKPPLARIYDMTTNYTEDKNKFKQFTILKSSENVELSGSVIPQDVSICDECLSELRDPKNKRYNYFFITCTNCGPRYTIIEKLPYDRLNTTMQDFFMCDFCFKEYNDPSNRRFHAQTVACPKCGPKVYLTTNNDESIKHEDPIREAGKLLEEGYIVAIKGNGGFHIATSTTKSEPIARLRKVKYRAQKPFAIMARDIDTTKSFAEVNMKEAELLTCYIKPIVLLKKRDDYYLSELISPGLHNIGVMLPYTGLHAMLFDKVREPAFVMTSANPPNEPIVTENVEAMKKLGSVVDFFLFHNRTIAHRCDDSVVRLHGEDQSIIRRSRGYAPEPVHLKRLADSYVLGVGAEFNVTSCVLLRNKAFISQHAGDVDNLETLGFLKSAINHLIKLTNSKVEVIACDLHPKFTTTRLAQNLGEKLECSVVPVQHHHAHIASLMGEHDVDEMIGIACDGFGYGSDGNAWGGEILYCNHDGFQRLGHLQEQPMVGGDLATLYPLRVAAGILYGEADIEEWLLLNSDRFPHGRREVEVIVKQLGKGSTPKTTSCGRVLDAVSAILGICYERTYEGEPAMKLESAALKGKDVLKLTPEFRGNAIDTTLLVHEIFNQRGKHSVADLACSAQSYLARSLAELAVEEAEQLNVDFIGFSGGVAYNEYITVTIRKIVEENGFKFLVHNQVPPGDGGISFGQVVAAAF